LITGDGATEDFEEDFIKGDEIKDCLDEDLLR
jgi:hypothetical protein